MTKIAKTTAKYSESHDRIAISVKFSDGVKLRIGSARWRDSMSTTALGLPRADLQKLFKYAMTSKTKEDGTKELNGERFIRVAAEIEKFPTIIAFIASIG